MNNPYVGISPAPLSISALKALVDGCVGSDGWLFLRWPHKVDLLPVADKTEEDLVCWEGQAFNQSRELRWKRKGDGYDVLLLSESGGDKALSPLEGTWETKVLDAKAYPKTETRLPKSVSIPKELDLGQRYFIDAETACVQFIALRVK